MSRFTDIRLGLVCLMMVAGAVLAGCAPSEPTVVAPTPADVVIASSAEIGEADLAAVATVAPPPTLTALPTTPPNMPPPEDAEFELGEALPEATDIPQNSAEADSIAGAPDAEGFRELEWEEMVPPGFRPEDIMAKYQDELNQMQDGDPAAMDLYNQMQQEFSDAPINADLDGMAIKLAGFIAPLEYDGDQITEFLLVPYFGACIHVPPPPANQTVHITTAEDNGIHVNDAYFPVWVAGNLAAEGETTDIGVAGYRIQDAVITRYEYNAANQ